MNFFLQPIQPRMVLIHLAYVTVTL